MGCLKLSYLSFLVDSDIHLIVIKVTREYIYVLLHLVERKRARYLLVTLNKLQVVCALFRQKVIGNKMNVVKGRLFDLIFLYLLMRNLDNLTNQTSFRNMAVVPYTQFTPVVPLIFLL